ncbi:general secretion pathway protein [Flavobacterium branchiicola]|uniref:General secretion pathway protein n=1 Tax=Flavobacterium branchiicola TaxID=1114875 RepID=A0ABV9PLG2_9FLAO|nr:general secretion pathway protein [Flavobacterium branchiicola]MBS7256709.1 general secretion pathway protein [Flavobacterium branchiicola]
MKLDKRNKLLVLGFFVLLYVCYSFAIANTISYYSEYKNKQEEIAADSDMPKLVAQLVQKEKQLDQILSNNDVKTSESFQNDLLKQLTSYSESYHLKIIDFKEPHIISQKGFVTTSYVFSLEGSFNGCLAVLNKVENNPMLGSIKHLDFVKKHNYKTNIDQLFVEVILQKNKGI